jgi:hypothetical protein
VDWELKEKMAEVLNDAALLLILESQPPEHLLLPVPAIAQDSA